MTKRVEGRISLKVHGVESADTAAKAIYDALLTAQRDFGSPVSWFEVVGLDLVQVQEEDDAHDH